MEWKVGFKLSHPFNADWGVGEVISVGPQGRQIKVHFSQTGETVTLSTHAAAFVRWAFPLGSRALLTGDDGQQREVVLIDREPGPDGFILYRTEDGVQLDERSMQPIDLVDGVLERLERLDVDSVEHYENRFAGVSLDLERQAHGLAGIIGARVTLFHHQLHVAYRVARLHPVRALLADEVGLGKTIEAGMIYSALRQAERAERVLVIAPESLIVQWLGELYRKFHDVFVLMDEERLEDAATDHPDQSPWQVYPRAVCSMRFLAENKLLAYEAADLEGGWDLLIVDEAHHLRYDAKGSNPAYEVVETIAENTRNILFLTATPMELDRREYFGLLRLLQPSLFHDPDLFEIQLEEIAAANELAAALESVLGEAPENDGPEAGRQPDALPMTRMMPADLPDRIADAFPEQLELEEYAIRAVKGDLEAARKLLEGLTHLHPLGDTVLSNTRARVGGFKKRTREIRALPISETRRRIYNDIVGWLKQLSSLDLGPRSPEARRLFELIRLASGPLAGLKSELVYRKQKVRSKATLAFIEDLISRCEQTLTEDTPKLDALLDEVRDCVKAKEKLLVFVSHMADLAHVRDRIEARVGVRVATFHEGLPATDRDIQVAMFRAPDGYPVLLCTEAGGEGRNFQFCHRLVHYDLPPSPNRVEQRIGRLDRIGQAHDVKSLVLVAEDTVEHRLAILLDEQIGVFEHTIGGLDPVLEKVGDKVIELALTGNGNVPEAWHTLRAETDEMIHGARDIITRGLDHLLHRGGFNSKAADDLLAAIPHDLEDRLDEFTIDFCEQTGLTVHEKDSLNTYYLALDRYSTLDALPGVSVGTGFLGTFNREVAVEREDYDYFATGHPLIEGIFSYIRDTPYGTTTLRLYKNSGFQESVGVQFNYRIECDVRTDVDASAFFEPRMVGLAVDLDGTSRPELLPMLTARFSKAYPLEVEQLQHVIRGPAWLQKARECAQEAAEKYWQEASERAVGAFEDYAREEVVHLRAFFEHRLDSAEAQAAFATSEKETAAAQYQIEALHEEWQARMAQLERRRDNLKKGRPILDSAAVYVIS